MTTVRFLNGLDTIGGNIVEIAQGDSRVIMDFGVAADLTHETVQSAIAAGKLPALPELFFDRPDGFAHEAIFISHLHIDHMGALQYLQKQLPIYLSPLSWRLYRTLIQLGIEPPVAHLHPLPLEQPLRVGSLSVTGFASDHDEPGAMALLVDDGQQCFGHSGDVRLNGPHRERVEHWADVFHRRHVGVMMLEATTFSFATPAPVEDQAHPSTPLSEASLQTHLATHLAQADQLVVINPYPRNFERLAAIQQTVRASGREMVWLPADATILATMTTETPMQVLDQTITPAVLRADPAHYVLETSWADHARLATLPVSCYLHSNGEPLGDYDPRFQQLQTFLAAQHIPLVYLSSSGHAQREDLVTLAQWIAPRVLVPWHTFAPAKAAAAFDRHTRAEILLPEKGLYYTLSADPTA